jgi:hypothetical protein
MERKLFFSIHPGCKASLLLPFIPLPFALLVSLRIFPGGRAIMILPISTDEIDSMTFGGIGSI